MSRNSGGNWSWDTPNVANGTLLDPNNENGSRQETADGFSDSLSRSGAGGMLSQWLGIDGSAAAPAYAFTNQLDLGFWRAGTNLLEVVQGASGIMRWSPTLVQCYKALNLSQTLAVLGTGTSSFAGPITAASTLTVTSSTTVGSLTSNGVVTGTVAMFSSGGGSVRVRNRSASASAGAFVAFENNDSTTFPSDPGTRWGYMGFPGGSESLQVRNERTAGPIEIMPSAGGNITATTSGSGGIGLATLGVGSLTFTAAGNGGASFSVGNGGAFTVSVNQGSVAINGPLGSGVTINNNGAITVTAASGQVATLSGGSVALVGPYVGPYLRTIHTDVTVPTNITGSSNLRYTVGATGLVAISGFVTANAAAEAGGVTAIASIPAAYAPASGLAFSCYSTSGPVTISIATNGVISLSSSVTANTSYGLTGITYYMGAAAP